MYEYIRGSVASLLPGVVVIEAGGIGYRVLVPLATSASLTAGVGETRLFLHHVLAPDQGEERLYGFASDRDRELFRALLAVQGIGPSVALQVMCAASPESLIRAITEGDVAVLKKLKGIGAKRAERMVVELRDRLAPWAAGLAAPGKAPSRPRAGSGARTDAIMALVALGYPQSQSESAVERASAAVGDEASTEALVKTALQAI